MTNIFNPRIQKLIKKDLLEYVKYVLGFIGLALVFGIGLPLLLNIFFGFSTGFNIDTEEINVSISFAGMSAFITSGFFAISLFAAGIQSGYELPQHVRKGIARKEYFATTVISAIIAILSIAPIMLLLNMMINLFVRSESAFYNLFRIGGGNIIGILFHLLIYTTLFILGYFIAIYWQRVGGVIAVATFIAIIITMIVVGWNIPTVSDAVFIGFGFDNYHGFIVEGIDVNPLPNHSFAMITTMLIGIFGISTYAMIRNVSIKVR